ncbi:helix-turn-helix transcriptional regulator [Deinococcus gobiensis]|uniref:Putative transcriptional regulator n=1 Tax=Deinococcus gobiensis (strain DSM 21396 / JCM 16679 / CGMCC 1.7299 / I-0) TaxID=745776 RepID=H8H128_DEIGI|nr:helix-turn-helix transcriptional regulator [Deinococcus gobiensis]AFD27047.1 putative transcriptional regulator [Deinococcus gobiensis I-0]
MTVLQPSDAAPPASPLDRRRELAEFLRSRRLRLRPEQVGLTAGLGSRRRTPGLRREEVALLAETSTTWYTWLEQRRDIRVSAPLLDRLARALRLDAGERLHLFVLAGQPLPLSTAPSEQVSAATERFVQGLTQPAYVLGRRWDYLTWNPAAARVFGLGPDLAPDERNVLRRLFLDPGRRLLYTDWACAAAGMVARFRSDIAPYIGEPWSAALIEDLNARSPEFRRLWARHDVWSNPGGLKDFQHPQMGRMTFEHLVLRLPDAPGLGIVVYTALPEWDTPAKFARLMARPTVDAGASGAG